MNRVRSKSGSGLSLQKTTDTFILKQVIKDAQPKDKRHRVRGILFWLMVSSLGIALLGFILLEVSGKKEGAARLITRMLVKIGVAAPPKVSVVKTPAQQVIILLRMANWHMLHKKLDVAREEVRTALQIDDHNVQAYVLLGSIYAQQQSWQQAQENYEAALAIDPTLPFILFDLAEVKFIQKSYDEARPGFVAMQKDKDLGDLAHYRVFLCDLLGGHEDVAAKELDAFNQVRENPSYYFGNVAWDVIHYKTDDARSWLVSVNHVYSDNPRKLIRYIFPLEKLGYLPLPPPAQ
jgi:Tfp pilus assembly protein PilF